MPREKNTLPSTRWLMVRLGHMGDVALTTGVLDYFGRQGLRFDVLTGKDWAGLFANHPHVGRVIPLDAGACSTSELSSFFRSLARQYKGWGLLDLHGNLRSNLLAFFWRDPKVRYRKMSLSRRAFLMARQAGGLAEKLAPGDALRRLSVPQRYALALTDRAPAAADLLPRIYLDDDERAWARELLDRTCGAGAAPVALHPFAAHRLKTWPPGYFSSLAALLDRERIPWIVLGKGGPLFSAAPQDLTNATSLRETCAVLSHCRVLVTGDSGPMHLATGVGTPVLALFGPTTREWGFYPEGPRDRVLETDLACRPCSLHGKKPCDRSGECLTRIRPEAVMAALASMKLI